jgi:hypothetical protein
MQCIANSIVRLVRLVHAWGSTESVAFSPSTLAKVAANDQPWLHACGMSPKILVVATTFGVDIKTA